jgi:hypothetical protein
MYILQSCVLFLPPQRTDIFEPRERRVDSKRWRLRSARRWQFCRPSHI